MSAPAFTVKVPCSTSNLGAGFDALGLALSGFWLTVRVRPVPSGGLRIVEISGEGAAKLPKDNTNRVLVAAASAAKRAQVGLGLDKLSAELSIHSDIPLARGLGSSAAAAVGGAQVVDTLLNGVLGQGGVFEVAAALEGHPDNVAAAVRGGMQVAVKTEAGKFLVCPVSLGAPLQAVVFVPEAELSTEKARAVLPKEVTLKAAIHNLSRTGLLVAALTRGRLELVQEGMRDALHQGPRSQLMPWLPKMIDAACEAGAAGAALSGAGTTLFALVVPEKVGLVTEAWSRTAGELKVPGRAHAMTVAMEGTRVDIG